MSPLNPQTCGVKLLGEILLILPCNPCVKLGDYSLCPNWRTVLRNVGHLVLAGLLDIAAVDSCKPGLVLWGDERSLRWCDRSPRWGKLYGRIPELLELLVDGIVRDLIELKTHYKVIAFYVNVKAYRIALKQASSRAKVELLDLGPPEMNPLSYNKYAKLLRGRLEELLDV